MAEQPSVADGLRQGLHEQMALLPGALATLIPDLMVDYLATVFTDEDTQPVARDPAAEEPGGWALLEGCLAEPPGSERGRAELADMAAATDMAATAIAGIARLEVASKRDLGYLAAPPGGDGNAEAALVVCTACKRVMLAGSFEAHRPLCRGPPAEPPPPKAAKRASSGGGAPAAKRLGKAKPPPGKSKLSIGGRPRTPPGGVTLAGRPPGLPGDVVMLDLVHQQWAAPAGTAAAAACAPPPRLSLGPSKQEGAATEPLQHDVFPARRRRTTLDRKRRNVDLIKFAASPPRAAAASPPAPRHLKAKPGGAKGAAKSPAAKSGGGRKGRPPAQQQAAAALDAAAAAPAGVLPGWPMQQRAGYGVAPGQQVMLPMTGAVAPVQPWQLPQQMHAVSAPGWLAGPQPSHQHWQQQAAAEAAQRQTMQRQLQQQAAAQRQLLQQQAAAAAAAKGCVSAAAGSNSSAASAATSYQQPQATPQKRPAQPAQSPQQNQGGRGQQEPLQYAQLSPQQQEQQRQTQAAILKQQQRMLWAQLSPQQQQQAYMRHRQRQQQQQQAGFAGARPGASSVAASTGQAAVMPAVASSNATTASGTMMPAAYPPAMQQQTSSQQQQQQFRQQQAAASQPLQNQASPQHGNAPRNLVRSTPIVSGAHPALRQSHAQSMQDYLSRQQLAAQGPPGSGATASQLTSRAMPISPGAHQYPAAYGMRPMSLPGSAPALQPMGSPPPAAAVLRSPGAGRTLAEQHFLSSNEQALQAVAAEGMPPPKTYSSLKTLSAQLPTLAAPSRSYLAAD